MPQPGLHGALALASRRIFPRQRWFSLGLTFGALVPDVDSYAQAFAVIAGTMNSVQAEALYHRTLTHSLFFAIGVTAVFSLLSVLRGGTTVRSFGLGVGTGMALLHIIIDIFAWFDGVGILWPLWSLNLWKWVTLSDVVTNLLRAGNFYAFALYFAYLMALARGSKTDAGYLPRLRLYALIQLGLGIIFTFLAAVLSAQRYNVPDGAVFLFWAYPNALWVTWRMRATIEGDPLPDRAVTSAVPGAGFA